MSKRRAMSRHEMEEHTFHPAVLVCTIAIALFLGAYLPHRFHSFEILDLPFLVVLFFAVSWRNPLPSTLCGAIVGILQDLPTNQYIGVDGIAKTVVGYVAGSVSLRVDVDNILTRAMLCFGFSLLNSLTLFTVRHWLLDLPGYHLLWLHELLRATVNTAIGVPIFLLLDRTRIDG